MLIKRRSPFSGKWNEMEIPVRQVQIDMWKEGTLIQKAMPNLTADQREFIMTGITPKEWEETFNPCRHENTTLDARNGTEWCNDCGENSHAKNSGTFIQNPNDCAPEKQ